MQKFCSLHWGVVLTGPEVLGASRTLDTLMFCLLVICAELPLLVRKIKKNLTAVRASASTTHIPLAGV